MKMHHIAITVQNIKESIDWYTENLNAEVLFEDKTWGLVSVNGFKIAFVFKDMHPPHLCFEIDEETKDELSLKYEKEFKAHRDGSEYIYVPDISGNTIEFLYWPDISVD